MQKFSKTDEGYLGLVLGPLVVLGDGREAGCKLAQSLGKTKEKQSSGGNGFAQKPVGQVPETCSAGSLCKGWSNSVLL
jgi:hypothetical protein